VQIESPVEATSKLNILSSASKFRKKIRKFEIPVSNPDGAGREVLDAQPAASDGNDGEVQVVGADQDDRRRRLVLAVGRLPVLQPPEQVP